MYILCVLVANDSHRRKGTSYNAVTAAIWGTVICYLYYYNYTKLPDIGHARAATVMPSIFFCCGLRIFRWLICFRGLAQVTPSGTVCLQPPRRTWTTADDVSTLGASLSVWASLGRLLGDAHGDRQGIDGQQQHSGPWRYLSPTFMCLIVPTVSSIQLLCLWNVSVPY